MEEVYIAASNYIHLLLPEHANMMTTLKKLLLEVSAVTEAEMIVRVLSQSLEQSVSEHKDAYLDQIF